MHDTKNYMAEISRANPTCFLLLVNQSAAMRTPLGGGSNETKAQGVADAVNRFLQTLVLRCARGNSILDRYYIGIIGYGKTVGSGLGGELAGQGMVPISEIGDKPMRIDERSVKEPNGVGEVIERNIKFPIWFEPVAENGTPMCEAFRQAHQTVTEFIDHFPNCFPPIVINITEGLANDGDPEPLAAELRKVCSEDGNVLVFNVYISDKAEKPIQYPNTMEGHPNPSARKLFRMSSELPPFMSEQAGVTDPLLDKGARGFICNGNLASVIQLLDIGTRIDSTTR